MSVKSMSTQDPSPGSSPGGSRSNSPSKVRSDSPDNLADSLINRVAQPTATAAPLTDRVIPIYPNVPVVKGKYDEVQKDPSKQTAAKNLDDLMAISDEVLAAYSNSAHSLPNEQTNISSYNVHLVEDQDEPFEPTTALFPNKQVTKGSDDIPEHDDSPSYAIPNYRDSILYRNTVGRVSCLARIPFYLSTLVFQICKMAIKFFAILVTGNNGKELEMPNLTFAGLARDGLKFVDTAYKIGASAICTVIAPPKGYKPFLEAASTVIAVPFEGDYHPRKSR